MENDIKTPEEIVKAVAGNVTKELTAKFDELKAWKDRHDKGIEETKAVSQETKNAISTISQSVADMNAKITDIVQKTHRTNVGDSPIIQTIGRQVIASEVFKAFKLKSGKGNTGAIPVILNAITSDPASGGSLIAPDRLPGIITPAQKKLTIRSLLAQGQTDSNLVEFVKEKMFTNNAAPVAENTAKAESNITFEPASAPVRTIAHWIQASLQMLADDSQLESYINGRMQYGLLLAEEIQLLLGDGTGQNLLGLIPAATAYDTSMTQSGDQVLDIISHAMLQIRLAEYPANGIVMNPIDVEKMRLLKDTTGSYIFANPASGDTPSPWGLQVVESTSIAAGQFLIGAFNLAAQIFDRQDATIDISTEDRDNFIKNMATVRAEERLALTIYRPAAIVTGSFE